MADTRHLEEVVFDRDEFASKTDPSTPRHYDVKRFGRGEGGKPIKRLLQETGVAPRGHVVVLDESFTHQATFADAEEADRKVDEWVAARKMEGVTRGRWKAGGIFA